MKRNQRSRTMEVVRPVAALLAALLLAGGCGSSQDDAALKAREGQPAATEQTAGTAAPEPTAPSPGDVAAAPETAAPGDSGASPAASASSPGQAPGQAAPARKGEAAPAGSPGTKASPASPQPGKSAGGSAQSPAGGSAPSPAPRPQTPALPGTPQPTGPKAEIVFGSIHTMAGPIGDALRGVFDANKAWVAAVNAKGGLNGHPVRVIYADDGGDNNKALALARQLVEEQKVIGFFGIGMVTTFPAVKTYLEQMKIPVIGSCNCEAASDQSPMVFLVGTGLNGIGAQNAVPIKLLTDKRKVAVLWCREVASCKINRDGIHKAAKQVGLDIVYDTQTSLAQPDYTAEVIAARNAGAEALALPLDNASQLRVVRSAKRQGWTPLLSLQLQAVDERFAKQGGADVDGFLAGTSQLHWDHPLWADYKQAMAKYMPNSDRTGSHGQNVWGAGLVLEKIFAKGGMPANPTKDDLLRGLYGMAGDTLDGRVPPLTYKEGQPNGANPCLIALKIQGGKFVSADDGRWHCPPDYR